MSESSRRSAGLVRSESVGRRPLRGKRRPGRVRDEGDGPPVYRVMLGLQRSAGNAAVNALLSGGGIPVQRQVGGGVQELTLPEFVGDPDLASAFQNRPPIVRKFPSEKSPAIYKVQAALKKLGFPMPASTLPNGEPDGIFGKETESVVTSFQGSHGLQPDGRVGHATLSTLQALLAPSGPTPLVTGKRGGVDSFTVQWFRDPFSGMSDA